MKFFYLFIIFIIYNTTSSAKHAVDNDSIDQINLSKGEILINDYQFDKAIDFYHSIIQQSYLKKDWENYFLAKNQLGYCYRRIRNYDKAYTVLNSTIDSCKLLLGEQNKITALGYFYLGQYYDFLNNSKEAINYYTKALNIRLELHTEPHKDVALSYYNLGNVYNHVVFNYKEAEVYYKKALSIELEISNKETIQTARIYNKLGSVNRQKRDYDNAILYTSRALEIHKSANSNDNDISNILINLGNIYLQKNDFKNAIKVYLLAIELKVKLFGDKSDRLIIVYNNLGTAFQKQEDYSNALKYYNKALDLVDNFEDSNSIWHSNLYLNIGLSIGYGSINYSSAKYYLNKSLKIRCDRYGNKHPEVAKIHYWIGKIHQHFKENDKALEYFQNALVASIEDFNDTLIQINPNKEIVPNDLLIVDILKEKANILKLKANFSDSLHHLLLASECYTIAREIILSNRFSYIHDGSKLFLFEEYGNIFEEAIDCYYQLFEQTKDENYLNLLFSFMETNKAGLLVESIYSTENNQLENTQPLLKRRKHLINVQEKIKNEILQRNSSDKELNQELFRISIQLEQLSDSLNKLHPQYHILLSPAWDNVQLVQNKLQNSSSQLIEYFFGEKHIYMLGISSSNYKIMRIINSKKTNQHLADYYKVLTKSNEESSQLEEEKIFFKSSFNIYKELVHPVLLNHDKINNLIIVPDGILELLPFESLVTLLDNENINYKNAPYLLYEYSTRYLYSSSLLNSHLKKGTNNDRNNMLAFSYSDTKNIGSSYSSLSNIRDSDLNELPGTGIELQQIANYFEGDFFMGDEATKQNFLEKANNYNIIHLALHGYGGKNSKYDSRLFFNPEKENDSLSGVLFTHELLGLGLNANLVVLSACESGIGKQFKREGVFSVGRGFIQAGCPTVLNSLWNINDFYSAKIIINFYKKIYDGKPIDKALQSSKIDFLTDVDEIGANPYHWAGFTVVGQNHTIESNLWNKYLITLLIVLNIIVISVTLFIKKIKNKTLLKA
ncbi:CHAT domain-containing protein [Chondrinema litorale]|uniref:CHAT domain-containing protein n=1 Tax=Chondrinema litorale TaxID=2994555 RepID=UPI0025426E2B|nr:CHAT domain-containing tetratricopeptide repeat protein [Chondrinema litorale]UZS00210.1 CHAT domain-containing protein [Chondrinema litorale]